MEFWGVEVKAGEKLKCRPELGKLIHISQAAMGEVKDPKGAKNVPLRMTIDDKKFVIGSLSAEDRTQVMFDLVFEKEFELSHDLKNASVYFIGYIADDPVSDEEVYSDFDDESEDEELPVQAQENGTVKAKAVDAKPAKKEEKVAKKEQNLAKKEEDSDDDSEEDSDFSVDDDMSLDGAEHAFSDSDGSDEEGEGDSSEEEEIEVPKAKQSSKKRQAESAEKTPAAKKAKAATPEKTGKKGQNSTPAPSKSAGKKKQSPKSAQVSCKSCTKTFTSDGALQSHSKAKHGGK